MRTANLGLTFLVELAAFTALAVAGVRLGAGPWAVVLGIGLPLLAVLVWARWNAPRSAHRLPTVLRVVCELAVYAVAVVLLAVAGAPVWAAGLGIVVVVNVALLTAWRQWDA